MGREFEVKMKANLLQQEKIRQKYGGFAEITMETTYYDTPTGALAEKFVTLRRRLENGKGVCTLKMPGANGGRGEWETEGESLEEALPMLCKLSGWDELAFLTQNGVAAVCGARFVRRAKTLTDGVWSAEIALDLGVLLGGGKEMPLCEVEVEHKAGDERQTRVFARALAEEFGLLPEISSKFRRALALAEGEANGKA